MAKLLTMKDPLVSQGSCLVKQWIKFVLNLPNFSQMELESDNDSDPGFTHLTQQPQHHPSFNSSQQPSFSYASFASLSQPLSTINTSSVWSSIGPCPICRSTVWKRGPDGSIVCQYGHRSMEYREEQGEHDNRILGQTRKIGPKIKKRIGGKAESKTEKPLGISAVPLINVDYFYPSGVRAQSNNSLFRDVSNLATLAAFQWVLKRQLAALQPMYPKLDQGTVQALWSLFLSLIEDPSRCTLPSSRTHLTRDSSWRSMTYTLVIMQLSLRAHGYPVLLADLAHMADQGRIPFYRISVPQKLLAPLPIKYKKLFGTHTIYWQGAWRLQWLMLAEAPMLFAAHEAVWTRAVLERLLNDLYLDPATWTTPCLRLYHGINTPASAFSQSDSEKVKLREFVVPVMMPIEYRLAACIAFLSGGLVCKAVDLVVTKFKTRVTTALINWWHELKMRRSNGEQYLVLDDKSFREDLFPTKIMRRVNPITRRHKDYQQIMEVLDRLILEDVKETEHEKEPPATHARIPLLKLTTKARCFERWIEPIPELVSCLATLVACPMDDFLRILDGYFIRQNIDILTYTVVNRLCNT